MLTFNAYEHDKSNAHLRLSGNISSSTDLTATLNQYCLNNSGVCSSCTRAAGMFVADIATEHSLNEVTRAKQATYMPIWLLPLHLYMLPAWLLPLHLERAHLYQAITHACKSCILPTAMPLTVAPNQQSCLFQFYFLSTHACYICICLL